MAIPRQDGLCANGACRRKASRTITFLTGKKFSYCGKCGDKIQAPAKLLVLEDGKVRR